MPATGGRTWTDSFKKGRYRKANKNYIQKSLSLYIWQSARESLTYRQKERVGAYSTGAGADLLGLTAAGAAVVEDTGVLGIRADVLEGGGVAELGVDADNITAVAGGHALHVDVALALGLALFGRTQLLAGKRPGVSRC